MGDVVHVTIKKTGMTYAFPGEVWRAAVVTFDQHYRKGTDVPRLCSQIAADLVRDEQFDPFGRERLRRCLLSVKGKRGAQAKVQQASLFS